MALLYQTYSGRLFRLCADIVKDKDAARDLLHDGFIIIFSSIGSLRSPARLEVWMSRVMANLAVKYLNDRKNRPELWQTCRLRLKKGRAGATFRLMSLCA